MLLIALNSCTSLVYSPAIHLPKQKLEKSQIELAGGVEYLAETRPGIPFMQEDYQSLSLGFSGQIGYGLTNHVSVSGRGWLESGKPDLEHRYGYSVSLLINKEITPTGSLYFMPKVGMVHYGSELLGYGAGFSLLYQHQLGKNISFYSGAGMIWGFALNSERRAPAAFNNNPQNGIGYHFNNGIAWQFWRDVRLNVEIIPTIQLSNYDAQSYFLLPCSIGLGYTF